MPRSEAKYPPGPYNWNAYLGLTWRHVFMLWWDPLNFVTRLNENYGDLVFLRLFNKRGYHVNHPDLIHGAAIPHVWLRLEVDTTKQPATLHAKWMQMEGQKMWELKLSEADLRKEL